MHVLSRCLTSLRILLAAPSGSSCSQTRIENHPAARSVSSTTLSLALFRSMLRSPVRHVGLWRREVLRAPMPEASVQENGYPSAAENHVRRPRTGRHWAASYPVAKPEPVGGLPESQFGSRVSLPVSSHHPPGGRGGGPGHVGLAHLNDRYVV